MNSDNRVNSVQLEVQLQTGTYLGIRKVILKMKKKSDLKTGLLFKFTVLRYTLFSSPLFSNIHAMLIILCSQQKPTWGLVCPYFFRVAFVLFPTVMAVSRPQHGLARLKSDFHFIFKVLD